jgi:hypothetical protein
MPRSKQNKVWKTRSLGGSLMAKYAEGEGFVSVYAEGNVLLPGGPGSPVFYHFTLNAARELLACFTPTTKPLQEEESTSGGRRGKI